MNTFILLIVLKKLFVLSFLLGLLFFITWILRNVKKDELKKLAVALLVIGLLGGLLTAALGGFSYKDGKGGYKGFHKGGYGMMGSGMWDCMKDDACLGEMESMMQRRGFK